MDRVRRITHYESAERQGLSGYKVGVGVLDSGVFIHDDLQGRVAMFRDFLKPAASYPHDETGHGTHVCGILAGSGRSSQGQYMGIAPGCRLYVGKILNGKGEGDVKTLIEGLEWLLSIAGKENIRVINISISALVFGKDTEKERLHSLLSYAFKNNILLVTAAGNFGPSGSTISKLGDSPYVICVGCHEGKDDSIKGKKCQDCSGRGPGFLVYRKPDIVAPGTDIISCARGKNQYTAKSGTSMATPIVSGLLALAFEKYPRMTAQEMKRRLIFSTDDLGENFLMQGFGMVNVEKMLE